MRAHNEHNIQVAGRTAVQAERLRSVATKLVGMIAALTMFGPVATQAQELCQPGSDEAGRECFVSPSGNDANAGTIAEPFATIARGVSVLQAGDVLSLRGGVYVEPVVVAGKHGTEAQPIVIRSYPGEQASIEGSLPEFRTLNNEDWEPASLYDPNAHPDEYVSVTTLAAHVRGVFLDRDPYTRLITYSRLEDLRAENETFDSITDASDPRPGPEVVQCNGENSCTPAGYRHPWVYMGPGIWIDRNFSPGNPQRVHIRLSHTHNNVPGLADYAGEVDPRKVRLAISPEPMVTLRVQGSSHVRFERLSIRYGGDFTTILTGVTGLVFNHVQFLASSHGVRTGTNIGSTFEHCDFDGGQPSWYFRNDGKAQYTFLENGLPAQNNLGKQTMRSLFVPGSTDTGTTIRYSELHDAHDFYLGGSQIDFHHNWISNLNDEGLFLDAYGREDVRVHENVILQTLSPISFASGHVAGPFYVYRNLIDVRAPTAGHRPRYVGDTAVWRFGNTFKSNGEDGPYAIFQNTFLVLGQAGQASYLHYRNPNGSLRRSFNNIFVAVNPDAGSDRPITFLPSPAFPAETDGHVYHRIGEAAGPLYRYLQYQYGSETFDAGTFDCLTGCTNALHGSLLLEQSKTQYAPGFEANSIEADPQFEQIGTDGFPQATDDLRLSATSPARGAGVALPEDLAALDADVVPPTGGAPDMGCCPHGSDPLLVGVDGRKSNPASADPQAPAPSASQPPAVASDSTTDGAPVTRGTEQLPRPERAAASPAAISRTVSSAEDLVSLLESDYQGEIVIPGNAVINLTGYRHLPIKAGITLKSDRGGIREGAILYTNDLEHVPDDNGDPLTYALFDVIGNDVRIEGLRFRGPSQSPTKTVAAFGIRIRSDRARRIVVLNNEFFGWTFAGVAVHGPISPKCPGDLPPGQGRDMDRWQAGDILVQRNYFHHNVMDGKGYGVNIRHGAYARIEANVFDYNRHAIASDGRPYTGYIARYNYVLQGGHKEGGALGYYNQHFDMHGCESGGHGGEAGEYIEIAYNTFRGEQEYAFGLKTRPAFWLRGTPSDAAWFVENVLVHDDFGEAIRYEDQGEGLHVEGNSFDVDRSLELGVGDFDGDGYDDVFVATGIGWYYSSLGIAPWRFITRSTKTLDEIGFGDFDGDGFTDVFESYNDDWRYFSGREHKFKSLDHGSAFGVSSFRFGDFDGNAKTDVLRANGMAWYVSWDARTNWDKINTASAELDELRLGDFNGDGKTDIFTVRNGEWSWSSGGQARWAKLNDALVDSLDSLVPGDFDGDGRTDVAYVNGSEWRFASGGQGASSLLRDTDADHYKSITKPVIGRFIGESCTRCQSATAQETARRDAFLRFEETPGPPPGSVIGSKFVTWVHGAPTGDKFFVVSRHRMR